MTDREQQDLRWLLEQMQRRGSMSALALARATKLPHGLLSMILKGQHPMRRHVRDVLATYFSLVECLEKAEPKRADAFPKIDWAKWLNELMDEAEVTEAEVAEDNDIARTAVHLIRRGRALPGADIYMRLDAYFKAIYAMRAAANRPEQDGGDE